MDLGINRSTKEHDRVDNSGPFRPSRNQVGEYQRTNGCEGSNHLDLD